MAAGEVVLHPDSLIEELEIDDEAIEELASWIEEEITRAESARVELRTVWENNLRLYEAIAERLRRNVPIENASNIEIPLGAIAADAVFSQIVNTIFNIDPLVTVREVGEGGDFTEHVKALQRFTNVLARKVKLRPAAENALLDDVKLGTGILYTRWAERRKKTVSSESVVTRGPVVKGVAVEDFYVPAGACDAIDDLPWCALRYRLTLHELQLRKRDLGWDISGAQTYTMEDRVRQVREQLGRHSSTTATTTSEQPSRGNYEIFDLYCHYDIDRDGLDEDLLVTWDRGSKSCLKVTFNPYDRRPFSALRYQLRAYLFYGLGVVEMLRPFQEGTSNIYNHWVDNSLLVNSRFWVGRFGAVPNNELRIWPNRFLAVQNPESDIKAVPMADTFPSAPQALQQTVEFAQRRVGLPEVAGGRPGGILGTRTPGITAMSIMQKSEERFGPAFDEARSGIADAVRQSVLRYQERILAGDTDVENDIMQMLGDERGGLVLELFRDPRFEDTVAVELTASNAQINREADRQNWILLMQQVITLGERLTQLAMIIDSPEQGPVTKEVARQLADVARELLDRVYRSFDQVRDPSALLLDMGAAIEEAEARQPQDALAQLGAALGMAAGGTNGTNGGGTGVPGAPVDETASGVPGAVGGF